MSDLSINSVSNSAVAQARAISGAKSSHSVTESVSSRTNSLVNVGEFVQSPKGVVDPKSGVYVLQYRDGNTGEVTQQYPSVKVVEAYKSGAKTGSVPENVSSGTVSRGSEGGSVVVSSTGASQAPAPSVGTTPTAGSTAPSAGSGSTSVDV